MQKSVSCCSECGTNPVESSKRRGSSNWRGFHSSRVKERVWCLVLLYIGFRPESLQSRSHGLYWPLCTADFEHVGKPSTHNKSRTVFHGVPRHSGKTRCNFRCGGCDFPCYHGWQLRYLYLHTLFHHIIVRMWWNWIQVRKVTLAYCKRCWIHWVG